MKKIIFIFDLLLISTLMISCGKVEKKDNEKNSVSNQEEHVDELEEFMKSEIVFSYSDDMIEKYPDRFKDGRVKMYYKDDNGERIHNLPDDIIKNVDTATLFYDILPKTTTLTMIGNYPSVQDFIDNMIGYERNSTINEFLSREDAWMFCYRYMMNHDEFVRYASGTDLAGFMYNDKMLYLLISYKLSLDSSCEKFTDEQKANIIKADEEFKNAYKSKDEVLIWTLKDAINELNSEKWKEYLDSVE